MSTDSMHTYLVTYYCNGSRYSTEVQAASKADAKRRLRWAQVVGVKWVAA